MEHRPCVQLVAGLVIAAGLALAVIRFLGGAPPGRNFEAAVGAAAFGAVIAAPGALALISLRQRPALVLPAAVVLVPLSFLSFALVTLPLLIPAVLLFGAFARASRVGSVWRVATTGFLVLAFLLAALVALFAHEDPRQFTTDTVSYGTSDIITYWEAALSLALTVLAGGIGWWLSPTVAVSSRGGDEAARTSG